MIYIVIHKVNSIVPWSSFNSAGLILILNVKDYNTWRIYFSTDFDFGLSNNLTIWPIILNVEKFFFNREYLFASFVQDNEITVGARDGAAHVLRCLKMWYDLPPDVLFAAINLVDRFLARMRARPKHMACISVGSLYLCVTQLNMAKIDASDLVAISQCRCTPGDLERMAAIISNKLGVQPSTIPVTALTFVRIYYHMFRNAAFQLGLGDFYDKAISLADLELRLEILICDALCVSVRASELALVLVCTQMDAHVNNYVSSANPMISGLVDFAIELQKMAKVSLFFKFLFVGNANNSLIFFLIEIDSRSELLPQPQSCCSHSDAVQCPEEDAISSASRVEIVITHNAHLETHT